MKKYFYNNISFKFYLQPQIYNVFCHRRPHFKGKTRTTVRIIVYCTKREIKLGKNHKLCNLIACIFVPSSILSVTFLKESLINTWVVCNFRTRQRRHCATFYVGHPCTTTTNCCTMLAQKTKVVRVLPLKWGRRRKNIINLRLQIKLEGYIIIKIFFHNLIYE